MSRSKRLEIIFHNGESDGIRIYIAARRTVYCLWF